MSSASYSRSSFGSELADVVQSCGVVLAHGDVRAFANAILYLAGLPPLRAELGRMARGYAETHLSVHVVMDQLEKDMLELVGEGQPVRDVA